MSTEQPGQERRVRVGLFLGHQLVREWAATHAEAVAYADMVEQELPGLRIAVHPDPPDRRIESLPAPSWWLLIPPT